MRQDPLDPGQRPAAIIELEPRQAPLVAVFYPQQRAVAELFADPLTARTQPGSNVRDRP